MKNLKLLVSIVSLGLLSEVSYAQDVKSAFAHAELQATEMIKQVKLAKEKTPFNSKNEPLVSPRTLEDGELKLVPSRDWTSGFFPGELWYLYEYTKNPKWLNAAKIFTADIEREKLNATTHDMGFKVFCSFGNAYRLTKDNYYKDVIIQSAKTLATRFNPKVGAIRSWDHNADKWDFPVIIDNMLNLELLFEATKLTGDSSFHKIAVTHANTTLKNHFRPDYSTYHVISYNPQTGAVEKKNTHQGYSHESAWARGQAWALYGYTLCYRYTKDKAYLKQAENIAKYIFTHKNLPADLIPYWDFDAPEIPNEPRDVSAATVIASGLYELSKYSNNNKFYVDKANTILKNLSTKYIAPKGTHKGFVLLHSTGSKPHNGEIDVPIIYAEYYYLEALLRFKNL
ncbi:glycoside hydrolase family 88 protein [Pedobacter glucosidilyticus]|uniref:glycoside hydrolase family 88 protein n=1 Tax=Pedobacter glucosidilyticus TaxID=1122941 RepID=UPI00042251B1|nr:glycoside hydrolase family 88 protein [Pedobacter glucosidilyticus]